MSKIFMALSATIVILGLAQAQALSEDSPLGDVARELRKAKQGDGTSAVERAHKVYMNADVVSDPPKTAEEGAASSPPVVGKDAGSNKSSTPHTEGAEATRKADSAKLRGGRPILDREPDATPDVIVVPAGTEIRVDVREQKVALPVRVGFSTPIPALSNVAVQMSRSYVPAGYGSNGVPSFNYVDYATATTLIIEGKAYEIQADTVPLFTGATSGEVTFVLSAPVSIFW